MKLIFTLNSPNINFKKEYKTQMADLDQLYQTTKDTAEHGEATTKRNVISISKRCAMFISCPTTDNYVYVIAKTLFEICPTIFEYSDLEDFDLEIIDTMIEDKRVEITNQIRQQIL